MRISCLSNFRGLSTCVFVVPMLEIFFRSQSVCLMIFGQHRAETFRFCRFAMHGLVKFSITNMVLCFEGNGGHRRRRREQLITEGETVTRWDMRNCKRVTVLKKKECISITSRCPVSHIWFEHQRKFPGMTAALGS